MQVEANDGESARSRLFRVTIKWAADVDVRALISYVECASPLTSPVSTPHRVTLHATPSIMSSVLPAALRSMLWQPGFLYIKYEIARQPLRACSAVSWLQN